MENMNPLTQDQLKEMAGKWVRIVLLDESETKGFAFINKHELNTFFGYDSNKYCVKATFTLDECGKEFEAYSLEEKHIDRDSWKPCEMCETCSNCWGAMNEKYWLPCNKCTEFSEFDPVSYCRYCGRPLTEEAWEELEQRLMG